MTTIISYHYNRINKLLLICNQLYNSLWKTWVRNAGESAGTVKPVLQFTLEHDRGLFPPQLSMLSGCPKAPRIHDRTSNQQVDYYTKVKEEKSQTRRNPIRWVNGSKRRSIRQGGRAVDEYEADTQSPPRRPRMSKTLLRGIASLLMR